MSDAVKKTKKCFIISAIGEQNSDRRKHFLWFMSGIIKPALSHFPEYDYFSSFDINTPGMISAQIVGRLLDDDLVIADMTFLNANVFYEMGIRHHRGKPIIHMMRKNPDYKIPFDVNQYRTIEYEMDYPSDLEAASNQLKNHINETRDKNYRVSNPVTQVRENLEIASRGTDIDKALLERIESLESSISSIKINQTGNVIRSGPINSSVKMTSLAVGNAVTTMVTLKNLSQSKIESILVKFSDTYDIALPAYRFNRHNGSLTITTEGWDKDITLELIDTLAAEDRMAL